MGFTLNELKVQRKWLKHGPDAKGGRGPCPPGCEKCAIEVEIKKREEEIGSDIDWKTVHSAVKSAKAKKRAKAAKRKPKKRSKEDLAEALLDAFEEMKAAQDRGIRAMVLAQLVSGLRANDTNIGNVMALARQYADEIILGGK